MDRAQPLIPVPILFLLILAALAALLLTMRGGARRRIPWLFPEACVLAGLAALHLLFFWQPYRSAAQVPAGGGDLASFFYPLHAFAAREFQAGRIPFWSPHQFGGMPHLANFQTATLYPPNIVAYLLSEPFSYAALERLALLHFLIASYGAYWLVRALGLGRFVALVSGVVFAYSGFMAAHLGHYPMLVTASWAPFVYAALIGTIRRNSWPLAGGGALALTLAILGGHQPMLLLLLSGAGLLTLFELWRASGYLHPASWREELRASPLSGAIARSLFILVIAVGLALPALGPALELTGYTARGELSYEEASEFSVEPIAALHMVLPTVYGSNPTDFWGPFSNTEIWGYAGIVTLIVATLGVVAGSGRSRFFWGGLALLGLLYAFGPYTPIHGWLYAFMPAFDHVRGAGRGYFFVDLGLAILAGYGLQAQWSYRERPLPQVARAMRYVERVGIIALAVLVLVVIPLFASLVLGVNDPPNRSIIALDNLLMLALWLGLTLAIIGYARRSTASGLLIVALLSAVLVLDLFAVTARFNPTTRPLLAEYDHPELVAYLADRAGEDGPFRVDNRATTLQPDAARLYGFDSTGGVADPLALESYSALRHDSGDTAEFLDELNVRYVVTDTPLDEPPEEGAIARLTTDRLILWELPEARSRAWLGDDPERAIAVETPEPGNVEIRTAADSPGGALIVSQADHPGWRATLDGDALPIGRYRGTLQQLDIPAGAHVIELRFEPSHWTLWLAGSVVSGLTLVTVLPMTSVPAIRRRREGGAG